MGRKLDILIPQYNEADDIVKTLLDSIEIQQLIDFDEVSVFICNDGSDVLLSEEMLNRYSFWIKYVKEPHRGVSAARNKLLSISSADYVMFCDADDMFFSALGLWEVFRAIDAGFDVLCSDFLEEVVDEKTTIHDIDIHENDSIFIHGKVFRRGYLVEQGIRFEERLCINEDSYFVSLCLNLTDKIAYISTPFYIWKYRKDSVSHKNDTFVFEALQTLMVSNGLLLEDLQKRQADKNAFVYAAQLIFSVYYALTDPKNLERSVKDHRNAVLSDFSKWFRKHGWLWDSVSVYDKSFLLSKLESNIGIKKAEDEVSEINTFLDREKIRP